MGIRQLDARATGRRRRYRSVHNLWLSALTAVGVLALPVAVAQADATWTGASTSQEWSTAANWTGTTPPTTSNTAVGTLTFPTLGTCGTCYTSHNGLSGISATTLVLSNTTKQYKIAGNAFTVGSGGIVDTPGGGAGDLIKAPLMLSGGAQTWTLGKTGGYNSLTFQGRITGSSAEAVTMSIPHGDLFINNDMEVGPITSKGPGWLHIGGAPGTSQPGSLNGTNAQTVSITGGTLVANPGSTSGPLTISGTSTLLLGTAPTNNNTTELQVTGPATLGSSTTTKTFIDDNGSIAGTDFSQLGATSNITLGGKLVLGQGPSNGQCVKLSAGDVATLVTTTGKLSGTFSNAPEGTILTMASSCQSTLPKVQIHYTSTSVTATVAGTATIPTTTSLAAPNPSPSSTNQTVTLTATVMTTGSGTVAPAGTVAFSGNAGTISGCTAQPLTVSGSSGTATCTTSFPASASPESLTAAFNPANGSGQVASTSSAQALTVNPAATTTALSASNTSPPAGSSVTYTATVTPANAGPTEPSGAVAFLDGGNPISGCTAQQLTAGSQSSTATCTVTYPNPGSHTITASYAADVNFTGATSQATTVTVQAATTTPTTTTLAAPNPSPASTNQSVTLTATVTTNGTGTIAPSGTVAFSGKAGTISGCTAQPLTVSGSSGTATCTTSFPASASPESLTAAFNPAGGSSQAASTSSAQSLTVNPGATTTALSASDTSPIAGASVTYTATVTPANTGPSQPSGAVAFLDGGSPISGCTAQSLKAGSQSSTATCTVTYPAAGSHAITAGYGADSNFTGSTSQPTTVTVGPAPTFPSTSVLDTFPQSGPLGSNWKSPALQDTGTVSVSATAGQTTASSGTAAALWVAGQFNAGQEAYLAVPVLPAAGHTVAVDGRVSSLTPSNVSMYFLQVTPSKQLWDLRKKINGAGSTSMKTFTAPFVAGDSLGLQLTGSTITAWHESGSGSWTPIGSVTDTAITAGGYIGFTLGDTTVRGGAFGGGN